MKCDQLVLSSCWSSNGTNSVDIHLSYTSAFYALGKMATRSLSSDSSLAVFTYHLQGSSVIGLWFLNLHIFPGELKSIGSLSFIFA